MATQQAGQADEAGSMGGAGVILSRGAGYWKSRQQETAPGLDAILADLRHDIAAWCEARPEASRLNIGAVYDELARLEVQERSLLRELRQYSLADRDYPLSSEFKLWEAQHAETMRAFETRRQLLRSRALDLSRDSLRPLKVTDLPPEVLHIVFGYLQADSSSSRQDVRNARLMCRLFCGLATPLMFPILRLHVSQESLDLADKISNNPAMAAGVRALQLALAYRPGEYADNLTQYQHARLTELKRHRRCLEDEMQSYPRRRDGEAAEAPRRTELRQALRNHDALRGQWGVYTRSPDRKRWTEKPLPKYMRILKQGHDDFRRLREEQVHLLQDASFANALASAVSRMPNARHLAFSYQHDMHRIWQVDSASLLNNDQFLSRFMSGPLNLGEFERGLLGSGSSPQLESARLLWEVPIALHKRCVALTGLVLSNIPLHDHLSKLSPQDPTSWRDLSAACASLEVFECHHSFGRFGRVKGEGQSAMDNYVGAILSRCGQRLRVLDLNFGAWPWAADTGPVLSRLSPMPRIQDLGLVSVNLQEQTLSAFCNGLGNGLKSLRLRGVKLLSGGWARPVDLLREKMAAANATARRRGWPMRRTTDISRLYGGEFNITVPGDDPWFNSEAEGKRLKRETRDYIYGTSETNPFRAGRPVPRAPLVEAVTEHVQEPH